VQLIIITIAALLYRLVGIVKPEGLWNDEYVSWAIAATPFSDGFIQAMKAQCHMPLYYFYLKTFMAWGGNGDLLLRLTSVLAGVLAVIVMYFTGKQKDKKTGIIASAITAFSSFLIYYSQEVRLYSLLFLLSALSLLYFIRFVKTQNKTSLIGIILFDFLIMFTHTIGFVFIFLQLIALTVLLFKEYKKQLLTVWLGIFALGILVIPNILHIFTKSGISQWWGDFSISKICFLMTDYFSPVLTNLVNAPDIFWYNHSFSFLVFTVIPAIIAIGFIIRALIKNKLNFALFIMAVCTVFILAIAAIMGKLVFITKYTIEIYPILIFLMAAGVTEVRKPILKYFLLGIFFLLNLYYLTFSPVSAPRMPRPQGHKIVAEILNNSKINDGDILLFEYYSPERFKKYIDINKYKTYSINKGNFYEFLNKNSTYKSAAENGKTEFKETFSGGPNILLEYYLKTNILDNMQKNQSLYIIVNDSVALYTQEGMNNIIHDDYAYKKIPLLYLVFSYIKNYTYAYFSQKLNIARVEKMGDWSVIKFTKLNK